MWKCLRISVRAWCVLSFVSAAAQAQAPETEPSPAAPSTDSAPSTAAPEAPPPATAEPVPEQAPPPAAEPPPAPPVETAPVEAAAADAPPEAPAPKPPPYSLPWQLRPVAAATVIRSDTAIAFYDPSAPPDNDSSGTVIASMLLASLKITPNFAPMLRLGIASNSPPDPPPDVDSSTVFLNPVIGATYVLDPKAPLRVGLFLGLALPLGPGGDDIEPEDAAALGTGIYARSAMDNAMFATNYLTPFPGIGVAYVKDGLTVQGEATFLFLTRVRGGDHPVDSQDDLRINFTTGLHVGYFFIPQLSAGAEIRYQRFLKNTFLSDLPDDDVRKANVDTLTFAVGPRLHFKLGETSWFRPGIAFAMGLDDPMSDNEYKIVQIDLPFVF